jgi:hypothetical protein
MQALAPQNARDRRGAVEVEQRVADAQEASKPTRLARFALTAQVFSIHTQIKRRPSHTPFNAAPSSVPSLPLHPSAVHSCRVHVMPSSLGRSRIRWLPIARDVTARVEREKSAAVAAASAP